MAISFGKAYRWQSIRRRTKPYILSSSCWKARLQSIRRDHGYWLTRGSAWSGRRLSAHLTTHRIDNGVPGGCSPVSSRANPARSSARLAGTRMYCPPPLGTGRCLVVLIGRREYLGVRTWPLPSEQCGGGISGCTERTRYRTGVTSSGLGRHPEGALAGAHARVSASQFPAFGGVPVAAQSAAAYPRRDRISDRSGARRSCHE